MKEVLFMLNKYISLVMEKVLFMSNNYVILSQGNGIIHHKIVTNINDYLR